MLRAFDFLIKSPFAISFVPVKPPHTTPSPLRDGGLCVCVCMGVRARLRVCGGASGLLRGRFLECFLDGRQRALVALRNFGGRGGEGRWPLFFCRRGSGVRWTGEFCVHCLSGECFKIARFTGERLQGSRWAGMPRSTLVA